MSPVRGDAPTGTEDVAAADAQAIINVLLIDDNADFPILIRRALEHRDPRYRVFSVETPEEGQALLDRQAFDLVLLDYKFPRGVNGLQVIRELKTKATYIPTVMVTASGDEGLAIQAMREGALDFVPKASDFIQALPDVAGRAIERGRIIRDRIATQRALEQRNRELQALSEITSLINASVDREEILSVALSRLVELFGAQRRAVHMVDVSTRLLVLVAGEDKAEIPLGSATSPIARAVADGAVRVDSEDGETQMLSIPLVAGSRTIGAVTLWLEGQRGVAPAEQVLAASIGKQVGVALERARLHADLATTRAYLADLVDNAADEVVTLDGAGRLSSWNDGAESIYGWTKAEAIGEDWSLLWPLERRDEARGLARAVLDARATIKNHETVRRTRDGAPVDVLLTLTPLTAPDGSVRGVSCLGKNVTTIKQLQAQLVQSEKMAVVGQLISGVAHELNNPLTSVLGYAQLVVEVDVGEKQRGYLQKITSEAGRCQRIVQNLLSFARKHEPRATRVDVNALLRDTIELRAYDLRVTNVELEARLDGSVPTTLADGHQLQQVFVNIVTNAQQALQARGRGKLAIETRLEGAGTEHPVLVVSFSDDGPGIPEALRKKIFDPFFTTKPVGEGTGLGLSLSYGIVKQHGGEITASASPEGGACFEVRLPVLPEISVSEDEARDLMEADVASEMAQVEARAAADPGRGAASRRRRILVVDDQAPIREMVSEALVPHGYDVVLARNGREALDLIESSAAFDMVLVDLRMPELGGDRLWRHVKRLAPELAERMVFASGDLSGDALRFLDGANNRCIAKPFGVDDVRRTVSAFFQEQLMNRSDETILIVDDEESIRNILEEKLEDQHSCRTAENGEEALAMMAQSPAGIVLCDVKMPGRDGIQVLGEIVKTWPDTAVVMITALVDVDVAVRALKLGAYDYITKPFHLEEVSIAVERALEKRRLRLENRQYQHHLEDRVKEQTRRIQELLTKEARARVLDAIYRAADLVDSFAEPDRTLAAMLKMLMDTVGAARGAVFTRQGGVGRRFAATAGLTEADREPLLEFANELSQRDDVLCATGDTFPDELRAHAFVRRSGLISLAHAPLRSSAGEDLGALYVDSRDNSFNLSLVGPEFFKVFSRLASTVVNAARVHGELQTSVAILKDEVEKVYRHEDIVGDSPAMQEVFRLVDKVKNAETTVLVLGESGTGKEKIARLVHRVSPRRDKPFVAVNCAALPSDLLESELFGIEAGTATGVTARAGKFEAANGGTIFLDEIGDLSPTAQAKLLRVIQEKQLERIGSNRPIDLDVRIIAATNVDLREAVQMRRFREDLYYRFNILPIFLPPLRERREDIPALVQFYISVFCREQKKDALQITDDVMDSFVRPRWTGNIRELKNALERAVLLSEDRFLIPHVEMRGPRVQSSDSLDLEPAIELAMSEHDLVAAYAKKAFDRFRRYDKTSDFLGISFKTLKKRLSDAEQVGAVPAGR